jgi:hypothetical protein
MDEEIDNTREIAFQIFSRPPQAQNTIQLDLEEETADIARSEGVDRFVFNILSIIIMHGVELLFGHRDILRLSEKNFALLQEYTNSFGYRINKKIDEESRVLVIGFTKLF